MHSAEEMDYAAIQEAVDLRHGHYLMLATILFFQAINWKLKSQGPPKHLAKSESDWRNIYISWIHAIITSTWTVLCMLLHPELLDDLVQHITHLTFFCICFSTGYFLYDLLDILVNNKLLSQWEIVFHHVVVIVMFYYNIYFKVHIALNVLALMVEINSIFLHWRKLLQMVKTPFDSRQYLVVKYLNLVTFFIFRGGVQVLVSASCFMFRHKMALFYSNSLFINTALFDILTVVLFWRLLRSDILRGARHSRPGSVFSNLKHDWSIISGYDNRGRNLACENGGQT